jgi:hypothetical protein
MPIRVRAAAGTTCDVRAPRFVGDLAQLHSAVGAAMGDALDCEHAVDGQGNTQQTTATGLAYYRQSSNAACFTTGYEHWALRRDGSVAHWFGDSVDPPE